MKKLLLIVCLLSIPLVFCFAKERKNIAAMNSATLPDIVSEFIKDEDAFNEKYNEKSLIIHHTAIKNIKKEKGSLYLDLDWYASGKTDRIYDIEKGNRITFIGYYDKKKNESGYPLFEISEIRTENIPPQSEKTDKTSYIIEKNAISPEDWANFKYPYYLTAMVRRIGRNWLWAEAQKSLTASVSFSILKDGSVPEELIKLTKSSGNIEFDRNVIKAIKLLDPFITLPDGYEYDSLRVVDFMFNFRNGGT